MNIVDLNSFRQKKKEQKESEQTVNNYQDDKRTVPSVNQRSPDNLDRFTREAMQFKFQNMQPPGVFAILNTEKLPPPFPPYDDDPFPPMVA